MTNKIVDINELNKIIDNGGTAKDLENYVLSLDDGSEGRQEQIAKEMNEIAREKVKAVREKVARDMGFDNSNYNVKSYYISLDKYLLFLSLGLFLLTALNFYVTYFSK